MILKIEHLGIAVKNANSSNDLFTKLLGGNKTKSERVESEGVETHFYDVGPNKIELLESLDESGVIAKFIEKRGEGFHHLAFLVDDIEAEMERLMGLGFEFINQKPKKGADNKLIAFLHPKNTNGILIELCMEITT